MGRFPFAEVMITDVAPLNSGKYCKEGGLLRLRIKSLKVFSESAKLLTAKCADRWKSTKPHKMNPQSQSECL